MRFIITGIVCSVILLNFPGCLTDAGKTEEAKAGGITNPEGKGNQKLSVLASKEDIAKTKEDLKKIATSLNFMEWYQIDTSSAHYSNNYDEYTSSKGENLQLGDFGSNAVKKVHVIESPYFWISFWNGYEDQKDTTGSNAFNETAIKNIFKKATEIQDTESNPNKKGLKAFVDYVIAFATEGAISTTMSAEQKAELTTAIEDLKKGDSAAGAVTNMENLILQSMHYSINKKLEKCNIFAKAETGELYFKTGIFTEEGEIKSVDTTNSEELKELGSEAIRGLTILKESINKKMLTTMTNEAKAVTQKAKQVKRIEAMIKKTESTLDVKDKFIVHITGSGTDIAVLTQKEIDTISSDNNHVLSKKNRILDGGWNNFFNTIRAADATNGVIPKLIETSAK